MKSILNDVAINKKNMDLELYYFGTQQCKARESWGPGIKNQYKLHYVHSGKGYLLANHREYTITAGQIFACYPNEIVYYRADSDDPWKYSWVAFNGLNSEFYFERAGISKNNLVIDCPQKAVIEQAFDAILSTEQSAANKDLSYMGNLYLILSSIVDKSSLVKNTSSAKEYIKEAIIYIKKHFEQPITISDISAYLSLDRKYFSKIFKKELQMSPLEYLINYRLTRACELMRTTNLSIAEIATTVGYDNQFSFSRVFKKYKGISPSDYRKLLFTGKETAPETEEKI